MCRSALRDRPLRLPAYPFPFDQLPRMSRHEARAASLLARGVPGLSLERALDALTQPLGERPRVRPLPIETWPEGSALQREVASIAAVVIADGVQARSQRMVLELDEQLAGFSIDRALGASSPEPRLSPGPITDGERGTLAYLGASALRHADAFRVVAVITTLASFEHALGEEARGVLLAMPAHVELAGVQGWARLWVTPSRVREAAAHALDPRIPLELSLVGGQATLPTADVAALSLGDVVVPERWTARPSALPGSALDLGCWLGEAHLVSVHGGPSLAVALGPSITFVGTERAPSVASPHLPAGEPASAERRSQDMSTNDNPVPAAEIPVELSVELGRLAMSAGELSSLVPGAVLVSGIPAGQPVTLRAGAKVIARGELVVVDGELGVRIQSMGA